MKNKPSAFPWFRPETHRQGFGCVHVTSAHSEPGMELRDFFAAQALPAVYHAFNAFPHPEVRTPDAVAVCAYRIADARLRAR